MRGAVLAAMAVAVLVALWETAYLASHSWLLPSPGDVARSAARLGQAYAYTAYRSLVGYTLGSALGILLGIAASAARGLPGVLDAAASLLAALPPVVLVPLLILWVGFGEALPLTAASIAALIPVAYNMLSALANMDPEVSDYISTLPMGLGLRADALLRSVIPQVLPALRLSAGMAWRVCFVVEMLAVPSGLGQVAYNAASILDLASVLAAVLLVLVSSYLHQWVLGRAERSLYRRWGLGTVWA